MILKKSRRILAFTLLLAMLLSILPPMAFAAEGPIADGQYVIAANVGGTYYAMPNTFASKIDGAVITVTDGKVAPADAEGYIVELASFDGGYSIGDGNGNYLGHGGAKSTNLTSSSTARIWTISTGTNGSYRIDSQYSGRALVFRAKTYNQFGGYATSNVKEGSAEYFDIEILPIADGSSGGEEPSCEHTNTDVNTVPATCTEDGYSNVFCTDCGEILSTVEIPSPGHSYLGGVCVHCGELKSSIEKTTDIAVGDIVYLVCESKNMELKEISTTSTIYGIGASYENTVSGAYPLEVVAGATEGTVAFLHEGSYLCWKSGNSLSTDTQLSSNSSWNVSFEEGNAVIKNAADATRRIGWNSSSPRFACYTSSQTSVQLYKKLSDTSSEPECQHENKVVVSKQEPTCTEDGYESWSCPTCEKTGKDPIDALGHNHVAGEPVAPTCTEEGYTLYTCTACTDSYKDDIKAATGHSWTDATCTEPSKCLVCGSTGGCSQISSIEDLKANDQIVIVAYTDGVYKALGTTINSKDKIEPTVVTVVDGSITSSEMPVWTLKEADGGFALFANDGYLACVDSANFFISDSAHAWKFATDESGFTITSVNVPRRGILYRGKTYNIFGAYATSNADDTEYYNHLLIFKKTGSDKLPHEDVDGNNHCDNCDFAPMQDAVLYGRTLSVKGNIAINFYMCLSEAVIKDGNAYMEFTQEGREDREPVKVHIKDCMVKRNAGHTHYSFPYEVAAKEMTDQITAKFFYGGECVGTYTYSVKEYVDNTFEKGTASAELEQLLKSMLHYGAASQLQFNYNTDRLANADLPETIDYSAVTIEGYPVTYPQGTKLAYLSGISLLLESETTLRFFFTAEVSMDQFSASYLGRSLEVKERGGRYYVDVVDIAAQDLDETVTIKISDGTNQDVEVFFCPLAYCQSVKENASGIHSEILQDCVTALFLYNRAADAYFASVA
ncbi:MAG: hypothetical protein J6K89_04395 [Oscillospiraceae bacterium]|nr:hypothetical protein [Oscillospiraceae bacterium]